MDSFHIDNILQCYGADLIIEKLQPMLTDARRDKIQQMVTMRLLNVQVAIEAPSDPLNAAAIVRTAEALGIGTVHVMAVEGRALQAKRTTSGAFHWLDTYQHENLACFLKYIHQGEQTPMIKIYGADLEASVSLDELPISEETPICLLFGNEHRGLSSAAKSACDTLYKIPMYGLCQSFNVSVSAAISLYDIGKRIRQAFKNNNHQQVPTVIDSAKGRATLAKYYLKDIPDRVVSTLFGEANYRAQ